MIDKLLLMSSPLFLAHDMGAGHPESPDRLHEILKLLASKPLTGAFFREPNPAKKSQLLRIHSTAYLNQLEELRGRAGRLDADTVASERSIEAAYLAAGSVIDGVDAILSGEVRQVFALVRPPGHHAERETAMGFCFFNNIAVGAAHAIARGVKRVLIVDWDVHHGNGTQHSFEAQNDLLFFDLHQSPLYPGSGAQDERGVGVGSGYTINLPLPAGHGDGDYELYFQKILLPAARRFQPELIMVSAGYDAHAGDPLANMQLTSAGYARLTWILKSLSEELCSGRILFTLEGGYQVDALARSVYETIEILTSRRVPPASSPAQSALQLLPQLELPASHPLYFTGF